MARLNNVIILVFSLTSISIAQLTATEPSDGAGINSGIVADDDKSKTNILQSMRKWYKTAKKWASHYVQTSNDLSHLLDASYNVLMKWEELSAKAKDLAGKLSNGDPFRGDDFMDKIVSMEDYMTQTDDLLFRDIPNTVKSVNKWNRASNALRNDFRSKDNQISNESGDAKADAFLAAYLGKFGAKPQPIGHNRNAQVRVIPETIGPDGKVIPGRTVVDPNVTTLDLRTEIYRAQTNMYATQLQKTRQIDYSIQNEISANKAVGQDVQESMLCPDGQSESCGNLRQRADMEARLGVMKNRSTTLAVNLANHATSAELLEVFNLQAEYGLTGLAQAVGIAGTYDFLIKTKTANNVKIQISPALEEKYKKYIDAMKEKMSTSNTYERYDHNWYFKEGLESE